MRKMSMLRPQAVILAAGKGTRMRSVRPKVLHPLLGLPLLEYVLRAVGATGAEPVSLVVGHGAEAVKEAFRDRGLLFLSQDPPRGTGHALQSAAAALRRHPERPVLVVNGDLPLLRGETLRALLDHHRASGSAASVLTMRPAEPGGYGRILRTSEGAICGIVEAKDASPEQCALLEVNAGAYVFDVSTLETALGELRADNAQGEYYLTDLIASIFARGAPIGGLELADADEAMGVNTHAELAIAGEKLRERILDALLISGVAIENPSTTRVGPDVTVEADATLRAFTILEGTTRIRAGAEVGPFARLVSVEVGAGAHVLDHCLLRDCVVEEDASVGPFAHIRPGSRIGAGAKVGNFVELKQTSLGKGSKAQHLSYLGDATIGPSVNIGAGTITCNYDGTHKHKTRIEEGAFVGSDCTLVAPVTVGAGAYVGAGSTITEDVPPDSLALGRARQVVKPGWARARKGKGRK
jgi:bifunctional UDP-N-acetylglucosamine pyrophosphorylase/glucosamine-1-phosphate N-acetyltransferase